MVMLTLLIDTQDAYWPDYEVVIKGGQVIRAEGIINLDYEEFSALKFAQEAGLQEVEWDAVRDATPGSLSMTILYFHNTLEEIKLRVEDPDVQAALDSYDLTETVERHTAETDL